MIIVVPTVRFMFVLPYFIRMHCEPSVHREPAFKKWDSNYIAGMMVGRMCNPVSHGRGGDDDDDMVMVWLWKC